ncbi:hypothetical protein MKW94_020004 [Papaver nudicaule]|uniref:PWI domain-containing protein n=1 Tax=Papaver nudicaule TaxID=74823 RepID=A0AA41VZA0_PAPNU|nr:hypothetical protein [Papaver nudicaule]
MKPEEAVIKTVLLDANYRFKPPSSQQETSLFKYLVENGGTLILTSSSMSINLVPSPVFTTSQDSVDDQKGGENKTTEIKTTSDGQKLHQNKRDRQGDISDVETSTKRRRTYVLEEEEKRNDELADNKSQNKNELKHEIDQPPGETNSDVTEDNNVKDRVDATQHKYQQRNSDFGVSSTKIEPGDVSTVRPADSALDISCPSEDYDASKEKSTKSPIIDYAIALHEHKYNAFGSLPVNLFEAADLLKCIPNVYPVDQRSELQKEIGMFRRDWLTHHRDPSIKYLDIFLDTSCDRDIVRIYESEVYIQVQNLVKTFDKNTVVELKHFIDMLPVTKEVFTYEINWAVVDKYALHEKMRPWISKIAINSTNEEADGLVSDIVELVKNHGSASSVHKEIMSLRLVNDVESERFFQNMWTMLFSEIKKLKEVDVKKPSGVEIFNETPKTKEEVLSLEINWAVFDQHKLHEKMRPWIRKEVMELLKTEKASVVDQVVDGIKKQTRPFQMLELLELSLDTDTEMVVRILWRTLLILVKIFETAFPISISSVNPNTELSNVEDMPSDNNLRQPDSVWNGEESSDRVGGVIERNRRYSYPSFWRENKMLAFEFLCEANRLGNAVPRNMDKLSSYEVDWVVSDKEELYNRLRPWIFREITEFVRQEEAATLLVDSVVLGIKEHANAKDILELVKPSLLGERSVTFVLELWNKLIFGIHLSKTTGLDSPTAIDSDRSASERVNLSQYGDRFSRNRHFMMVAFDYDNLLKLKRINEEMPNTKEELFSYEIQWDIYEKHELQRNMRKGIWIETLEFIRQNKEAMLVDEQIMWSIFDYHVSASQREFTAQEEAIPVFEEIMSRLHKDRACPYKMVEFLEPKLGNGAEKFVMRMWYALICGVKFAEARVEKKCNGGSVVLLPVKDQAVC